MTNFGKRPNSSYGVLRQEICQNNLDLVTEQIRRNGFALLDSGYSEEQIANLSDAFDELRIRYLATFNEDSLKNVGEYFTMRAPLTLEPESTFMMLAFNSGLLHVVSKLIQGKFILNQQNGVIFPTNEDYDQGHWHRDLPYQHYVSTTPLAVNALFCLDDLGYESGAMWVVPGSHKEINCPSDEFIKANGIQIESKRGQFVMLDCMTYHCGGFNNSNKDVRAVNHVYTIPYFKQQISIPKNILKDNITDEYLEVLGFSFQEPESVNEFLSKRKKAK